MSSITNEVGESEQERERERKRDGEWGKEAVCMSTLRERDREGVGRSVMGEGGKWGRWCALEEEEEKEEE